jgi:hypothetical protein
MPDKPGQRWGSHLGEAFAQDDATRPESRFILARSSHDGSVFFEPVDLSIFRKVTLENLRCLRCNREIESGQKSLAVYMFTQTVGVRPRQKSAAHRICFCPQCSVSLAMGPPPEGALNVAAWKMIRDLVGADPALTEAAWESLRGVIGLLPAAENEARPTGTGGYFEF